MMRCFLPCCFRSSSSSSSSKRRNHFHSSVNPAEEGALEAKAAILIQPKHQNTAVQESIDWIAQSKIEKEEEESYNRAEVKITTDQVTKSIGETEKVEKRASESERDNKHEDEKEECSESLFSLSIGSAGKQQPVSAAEPEVNSPMLQVLPASYTRKEVQHQVEGEAKVEARAMNHLALKEYRYRDCSEEEEYNDTDLDDEPSSESLFSLSADGYRKRNSSAENEKEVSSVLNPIENVSEVKVVRVVEPSLKEEKENINLVEASNSSLKMKKEMRLDSSFSSWLVESEESTAAPNPKSKYSHEDRPILGALTVEEINKYSSTASSRRSPNTPRMNEKLNWSSTSVRNRLEPAFQATL